jgi:hypothetical protein
MEEELGQLAAHPCRVGTRKTVKGFKILRLLWESRSLSNDAKALLRGAA